jgi:hypothetical protein
VAVEPPGTAATVRLLWLVKTPPERPPKAITETIANFPAAGNISGLSVLTAAGTGLLYGEWQTIDTETPGGASQEQLRQAILKSDALSQLLRSP